MCSDGLIRQQKLWNSSTTRILHTTACLTLTIMRVLLFIFGVIGEIYFGVKERGSQRFMITVCTILRWIIIIHLEANSHIDEMITDHVSWSPPQGPVLWNPPKAPVSLNPPQWPVSWTSKTVQPCPVSWYVSCPFTSLSLAKFISVSAQG